MERKILLLVFLGLLPSFAVFAADASKLARLFEIFYVKEELKSPYDKIEVQGDQALLSVWRDLPKNPSPEAVECAGYQWLLGGRGQRMGQGAKAAFAEFPDLKGIALELVELKFETKATDGKGKLQRETKPKVYLRMQANREALEASKLSTQDLKAALWKDLGTCLKLGRAFVTKKDINL